MPRSWRSSLRSSRRSASRSGWGTDGAGRAGGGALGPEDEQWRQPRCGCGWPTTRTMMGASMDREAAEVLAEVARLSERTTHQQRTTDRIVDRLSAVEARVDANQAAITQQGWQIGQILSQLQTLAGSVTQFSQSAQQQQAALRVVKVVVGLGLIVAALLGQLQGADRIGRALLGMP